MKAQITFFSYFDNKKYLKEDIVWLAKECKAYGVQAVHFHLDKLQEKSDIIEIARELKDIIAVSLSKIDFDFAESLGAVKDGAIRHVSLQASECVLFNKKIMQSYDNLVKECSKYKKYALVPEVHVFNQQGVINCLKLFDKDKDFIPVVNLGYSEDFPIEIDLIKNICKQFHDFSNYYFVLYNNKKEEYYKEIYRNGGGIRIGLEDNSFCGEQVAQTCGDFLEFLANLEFKTDKKTPIG